MPKQLGSTSVFTQPCQVNQAPHHTHLFIFRHGLVNDEHKLHMRVGYIPAEHQALSITGRQRLHADGAQA